MKQYIFKQKTEPFNISGTKNPGYRPANSVSSRHASNPIENPHRMADTLLQFPAGNQELIFTIVNREV